MSDSNEIPSLKSKVFNLPTTEEIEIFNRLSKYSQPPFSYRDYLMGTPRDWKSPIRHIFEEAMEGVFSSLHKIPQIPRGTNLRAVVSFEIVPALNELSDEEVEQKIIDEVENRDSIYNIDELYEELGVFESKDRSRVHAIFNALVDKRIIYRNKDFDNRFTYIEEEFRDFVDLHRAALEIYEILGDGNKQSAVSLNKKHTYKYSVYAQQLEWILMKLKERGRVDFIVPEGKKQKLWFRTDLVK